MYRRMEYFPLENPQLLDDDVKVGPVKGGLVKLKQFGGLVSTTAGTLRRESHLVRYPLRLQRTGPALWTLSFIRNAEYQNETTQRFKACWHEYLQRCGKCHIAKEPMLHGWITRFQILCLITGPVSLVIDNQVNSHFAFIGLSIIFCCFLSMALIFLPKVVEIVRHRQNLGMCPVCL